MQVLLFLALSILATTGLTNWLLPHGGSARALRHLLRWIHEGAAWVSWCCLRCTSAASGPPSGVI
jgi:hypothetical protein